MAQNEQVWLDQVRACVLRGDFAGAESLLASALTEHPYSFELRRILAGVHQQAGRPQQVERLLRDLLRERPHDFASAYTLARLLVAQARSHAAAQILRGCFEHGEQDPELAIQAIELLDEADRKADAAVIADLALTASPHDARLHAYAGMLRLQLGEFDSAREHYLFVMENSPQACEWNAPYGLSSAQRYREADHPDFARFQECLTRRDLSERARSVLLFALGKAYDDIGDYARASSYFRQANILARSLTQWSRHVWRRGVAARLATGLIEQRTAPFEDLVPVFIVGMPRSGTTLLAEQLARFPRVRNRGELPWLARVGKKIKSGGSVEDAAALYAAQIRQDDWGDAHWFVDKQPLNFRYLDIALAMFPNAKVIHCARNARDTALSLWTQSFAEEIQGYAYDFNNIALVMHDCECLIAHWRALYADSIRRVCYEELVRSPKTVIVELLEWLGIKYREQLDEVRTSSINTASVWQARQPIYSSSVGRWRNYIGHVPELASFRAEE